MSREFSLSERVRRKAGGMLVDGFFHGISRLGKLHPNARPERHGVEVERDVAYLDTGRAEHRLDVYRPTAGPPRSVVMYVHGGGFRILSKDTHWVMALAYARRGHLVFNVSYRLAPEHPFPAAVEDVAEAYAWIVKNAHRYGGDPSRLILAGESAGANLVTALTVASSYDRPEPFARKVRETGVRPTAVVAACGIFQLSDAGRFLRRKPTLRRFVADRIEEVAHAYVGTSYESTAAHDFADLLPFLERGEKPSYPLPPFYLPCGTGDPLLDDTRRMARALGSLGTSAVASYFPGEPHAFHALVFRPAAKRCWRETHAFVDQHLG